MLTMAALAWSPL